MVSFGEIIVVISFFWLILIAIASRVDLQKYGLLVSSGFLLFIPDRFGKWLQRLADRKAFWHRLGKFSLFPTLVLFLSVPLLLMINLIKGIFFNLSPILQINLVELVRLETFLLILPALAIVLSFQQIITAIYELTADKELNRAGVLLVGIVVTLFASTKKATNRLMDRDIKLKSISVMVIVNLVLVLLTIPLGIAVQSGVSVMYEDTQGAIITSIIPGSPADDSNLQTDDVIVSLSVYSGSLVSYQTNVSSAAHFNRLLSRIAASTQLVLKTLDRQVSIEGITPPADADLQTGSYLGIKVVDYHPPKINGLSPLLPLWVDIFFDWLKNIALLLGIYTLLPLPQTPGYTLMNELIRRFDLDISNQVQRIISGIMVLVLAGNIIFFIS